MLTLPKKERERERKKNFDFARLVPRLRLRRRPSLLSLSFLSPLFPLWNPDLIKTRQVALTGV